ncbi:MAG: polymer-forming cytoskeletal protein [Pseudomonadota bacterium]|nr:polymer-forming cytoskeletal protein [Pseudomonadota bacterium]
MFNRRSSQSGGETPTEPQAPAPAANPQAAPRTNAPLPTEDLIARRPRPDIPRPRHEPKPKAQDGDESRLFVGNGITLKGEVGNCAELIVEGTVDARVEARHFKVSPGGRFSGECHVETADIAGEFEGQLHCRNRLVVRGTGRLKGVLRYGEVEIEAGGRIAGEIQVFGEDEPAAEPASQPSLKAANAE